MVNRIYNILHDKEQKETHEENARGGKKAASTDSLKSGKKSGGAKDGTQAKTHKGNVPANTSATATGNPKSGKKSSDVSGGA